MWKAQIKPGTEYALREKRAPGTVVQRVRVLEHIRGNRWKAEWIDPNPGLVHFVESGHIISTWGDLRGFLKEEAAAERLKAHNDQQGYGQGSVVDHALHEVFENVGDDVSFYRGVVSGSPEAIGRVKTRARMDPAKSSPVAYVDRGGTLRLPFDEALELARGFCAAEPAGVLADIESTESKWSLEANRPGEEHVIRLLNEYRASWALIRQWTSLDPAIAEREARIQRLERLVWDAVFALQKAKLDSEAAKLRRAIEGG
jgi:hypothetical protein